MASPGSRLSDKLRRKIEEIGRNDRKDVVGQTADGCAPLFWACKNGSAEVVEYLLTTCEADIEQVKKKRVVTNTLLKLCNFLLLKSLQKSKNICRDLTQYPRSFNGFFS